MSAGANVACSNTVNIPPSTGSSTNLGTRTATIDADDGENISCTFTNTVVGVNAARDLPACYVRGFTNAVKINVTPPAGTLAQAVEETPPAGWTVSAISDGGSFDAATGKVKWGPFFDATARMLMYSVEPPAGTTGPFTWSGTASFDGANEVIGGETAISQCDYFTPDYNPGDFNIVIGEVTGYAACWRGGSCAGVPPPLPPPLSYVTRSGFLWRSGEVYHRTPGCQPPSPQPDGSDALCWVPGVMTVLTDSRPMSGDRDQPVRSATGGKVSAVSVVRIGPGRSFEVRLLIEPSPGTTTQAVEYRMPPGATARAISDDGTYDVKTGWVKWGPFFDDAAREVSYRVTLPAGVSRRDAFRGYAGFDGTLVPIARPGAQGGK